MRNRRDRRDLVSTVMGRRVSLQLIIVALSILSYYGEPTDAKRSIRGYTKQHEEDLEVETQLRILNKPPIKTILTEGGDAIDCIDIHKQPALDNPLLKNHKIQMRPSFASSTPQPASSNILKRITCPEGTVPIKRTSKEDLMRAKSVTTSSSGSYYEAIVRSKPSVTKAFYGAQGDLSLHSPAVGSDQYSGAQVWVEGGPPEATESLIAGWAVAPSLYGDNRTHITTSWRSGSAGCFNVLCPGFVQVDKEYYAGEPVDTISEYGGVRYLMKVSIYQDKDTGNWWLQTFDDKLIGYWPKSLFKHLSTEGASSVAWGGVVQFKPDGPSPPMGNGYFPDRIYNKAASVVHLGVRHDYTTWYFDESEFGWSTASEKCYKLEYDGMITPRQGYSFLFGGPGGNCS